MPEGRGLREDPYDIAIIGGGVNGCGIARDAAGRGHSVFLAEQNDLASGTSSASTKLVHGGLRYLEHYEFRLVRESLTEREVLYSMAPHIIRPLRFVLPHQQGLRPAWMIRLGLFFYDHIGGRKILPPSRRIDLRRDPAGEPLKPDFAEAFEYSDCWVDDARLVVLNAVDAARFGADIRVRTKVFKASRKNDLWQVDIEDRPTGRVRTVAARLLVNAAGPWVAEVITDRIVSDEEIAYLCAAASEYFKQPVVPRDVVWTYACFRPLYDDGGGAAQEASRDYVLDLEGRQDEPPLLNVFGGKITTYRRLAEEALEKLAAWLPEAGPPWTRGAPLPGGDFPVDGFAALVARLAEEHRDLDPLHLERLAHGYGTRAAAILAAEPGLHFGADLWQREVEYLVRHEWATTADDILWRRSKLGLRFDAEETKRLEEWLERNRTMLLTSVA